MQALRTTYRKEGDSWVICRVKDLKKGDTFKLGRPDGTFVSEDGKDIWLAASDGYVKNNIWSVKARII